MKKIIEFSPILMKFSEFEKLSFRKQLLLTADFVEEFISKGGEINWMGVSRNSDILCPAKLLTCKFTDAPYFINDSKVLQKISDFVIGSYFKNDKKIKMLMDKKSKCIGTPEHLRLSAKLT